MSAKNEIREAVAGRRGIGFDEGDVELGVNIDNAGLQLDVGGKEDEEAGISAGDVGIGGDYAGFGDEKPGAHGVEALEADDGGFGALDDFFKGEVELECSGLRGGDGGDRTRQGGGDEFEIGVEVNGFDEPVFAVIVGRGDQSSS